MGGYRGMEIENREDADILMKKTMMMMMTILLVCPHTA
jgi:hypothetical protein